MSLTPAIAPDAKSQWRELASELQELVLDELDAIAIDPPRTVEGEIRRDAFHKTATQRHYPFLRFVIDDWRVTLVGIHHPVTPNE